MHAFFVCVFEWVPDRFGQDFGPRNRVKKECPRNFKKRVVFCKCFSNRCAERFFPDLGITFGACGVQNVIEKKVTKGVRIMKGKAECAELPGRLLEEDKQEPSL